MGTSTSKETSAGRDAPGASSEPCVHPYFIGSPYASYGVSVTTRKKRDCVALPAIKTYKNRDQNVIRRYCYLFRCGKTFHNFYPIYGF